MKASPARRIGGFILSALMLGFVAPPTEVRAAPVPCGDVQVIWARGSGAAVGNDPQYNQFYLSDLTGPNGRISAGVSVSSYQLGQDDGYAGFKYPAAGDDWTLITGAFPFLGPEYENSVGQGRNELVAYATDRVANCPNEVLVLAGFSQGAQVVGEGLRDMPQSVRDRVAYVALFGDPTLVTGNDFWSQVFQLWFPEMCSQPKEPWIRGSIYCGSLGGIYNHRDPYVPSDIALRVGSWCRDDDGVCSGGVALAIQAAQQGGAHFQYFAPDSDSAFAAREAAEALQIFLPTHSADFDASWNQFVFGATGADLAIVFDTTGSMGGAIGDAKTQATNVAQTWLNFFRNGRVGLVDFKDVNQGDPYVARVDLGLTNDVNAFQTAVNSLTASGGGDYPEAQLSGVMTALDGLDWASGATKVTIVITDAPGKDPEPVTGFTRDSVGQHALAIDPVSIYGVNVSGGSDVTDFMTPLTSATAGQVFVLQPGQTLSDALFDVLDAAHASPIAKLRSPYIAETGTAITFSAADSFDASADITSYEWDLNGDGTVDRTTTTPVTTYTYPGEFHGMAAVRVVASDGRSSIATADVTVDGVGLRDLLPIAPASVTASITGTNEVTVTWTPASNDRADGYKAFEADGTVVGLKLATDVHSTVIGGLDLSQPMTFKVVANNQYGNSAAIESPPVGGAAAWSGPATLNSNDALIQITPVAATGSDGKVHAAWINGWTNPTEDLFYAQRNVSTGIWTAPQRINDVQTGDQFDEQIAVDGSGNVFAIWADARVSDDRNIMFSKRSAATGTWSTSVRVNNDPTNKKPEQRHPAIAVGPGGDAVAIWEDLRSNKDHIFAARLPAGSNTWSANVQVTSVSSTKRGTDITIGSDGTAYAVWYEPASGDANIFFSSLPPGSNTWSAPVKISDDPGTAFQADPQIAVDQTGKLLVTWSDWRTNPFQLRARIRPAGGSWQPSVVVTQTGVNAPSLAMRSNGTAYVSWYDGLNSLNAKVMGSAYSPASNSWSSIEQVSVPSTTDNNAVTATALTASSVFVVYQNSRALPGGGQETDILARSRPLP